MAETTRPTRIQLLASAGRTIEDVIAPGLRVLFCGINPGLYSGYTGHHFARPGNRFWPALHASGFTDRLLAPAEERELLQYGYGITNMVRRATATADELTDDELREGGVAFRAKVCAYRPQFVAILGITSYRVAFQYPRAVLGRQDAPIGTSVVWVLPNPSGLNAHYTPDSLARVFSEFRRATEIVTD